MITPDPKPSKACPPSSSEGAWGPKKNLNSGGTSLLGGCVPVTCTLTTAGSTFSSIGAKLGSGWPSTATGIPAFATGTEAKVNPRLIANALSKKDFFFIRITLSLSVMDYEQ